MPFPFLVTAALSVGAAVTQDQARKQANAAGRKRARITDIQNRQRRRRLRQEYRQAQAAIASQQVALAGGGVALESSGVQGARGSTTSQASTLLLEALEQDRLDRRARGNERNANQLASFASLLSTVNTVGGSILDVIPSFGGGTASQAVGSLYTTNSGSGGDIFDLAAQNNFGSPFGPR